MAQSSARCIARQACIKDHRTTPQMQPYGFREHAASQYFVLQTYDMRDDGYEVAMHFVREVGVNHPSALTAGRSGYYLLHVDELIGLFNEA